ncbi:MAG: CsbD family protein [Panacagrimonas sp.]
MNHHTLKGQWQELTGKAKQEWGRLTQDDWLQIEGRFDRLAGKIQERYGVAREVAEQQIHRFTAGLEKAEKAMRKPRRRAGTRQIGDVTARERAAAGL